METGPANEFLASVGTTVLTRMDFLTLGHQRDVEATVRCSKNNIYFSLLTHAVQYSSMCPFMSLNFHRL